MSLGIASISYPIAHFGKTLFWAFFNTFFLFFAVYTLKLSPVFASSLILLFAITDALFDIPVSFLISKYLRRFGGMRFWVYGATPICSVALAALFSTDIGVGPIAATLVALVSGIVFKIAFTFVDVPLNASIGRFNYVSRDRNFISGARSFASLAANTLLAIGTAYFIERGGDLDPDRIWVVALIVAVLSPFAIVPFFALVDKAAHRFERGAAHLTMVTSYRALRHSLTRNLVVLCAANCTFLLLVPQFSNSLIFLVENDPAITLRFSNLWLAMAIVSSVTVWAWLWIAGKIEKARAAILCLSLTIVVVCLFPIAKLQTLSLFALVFGLASVTHVNALIWSMLPDVVDEASLLGKTPLHAPTIGVFAGLGKLMIGLSQFIGGILLQISGFPDSPNFETYQILVIGLTVAGCVIVSILFVNFRMTYERHQVVAGDLQQQSFKSDSIEPGISARRR